MGGPTMACKNDAIEADENNPKDSWESDTYSLTSSVMQFTYENGRRYHGYHEGAYWGPNDEKQNNQLDLHHQVYLMRFQKLFQAPVENPKNILDIGTGTGIWAIDVADEFPDTEVIGTDLSPTQPEWIPSNVHFEIDDAENKWLYEKDHFDLVHLRMLFGGISDWPRFIKQAYRHIKPGGWIEMLEIELPYYSDDGTLPEESTVVQWCKLQIDASERIGKSIKVAEKLQGWVEAQGFENVKEEVVKLPVGPWALDKKLKEIGLYNLRSVLEGLEGFTIALFTRVLGWKAEEVQVFLASLRKELSDPKIHIYYNVHVVYAQKPLHPVARTSTLPKAQPRDFSIQHMLNTDAPGSPYKPGSPTHAPGSPYTSGSPAVMPLSPFAAPMSPSFQSTPPPPPNFLPARPARSNSPYPDYNSPHYQQS